MKKRRAHFRSDSLGPIFQRLAVEWAQGLKANAPTRGATASEWLRWLVAQRWPASLAESVRHHWHARRGQR